MGSAVNEACHIHINSAQDRRQQWHNWGKTSDVHIITCIGEKHERSVSSICQRKAIMKKTFYLFIYLFSSSRNLEDLSALKSKSPPDAFCLAHCIPITVLPTSEKKLNACCNCCFFCLFFVSSYTELFPDINFLLWQTLTLNA